MGIRTTPQGVGREALSRNPGRGAVRSIATAPALLPQGERKNPYEPENPQGARYGAQGRCEGESGLSDQAGESMN